MFQLICDTLVNVFLLTFCVNKILDYFAGYNMYKRVENQQNIKWNFPFLADLII